MSTTRGRQAAMPFIMVTVLLDMMSIGIISPVLPKLIGGFMGQHIAGLRCRAGRFCLGSVHQCTHLGCLV